MLSSIRHCPGLPDTYSLLDGTEEKSRFERLLKKVNSTQFPRSFPKLRALACGQEDHRNRLRYMGLNTFGHNKAIAGRQRYIQEHQVWSLRHRRLDPGNTVMSNSGLVTRRFEPDG